MKEIQYRLVKMDAHGKNQFKSLHNILFKSTAITLEWIDWYWKLLEGIRVYGAYSDDSLVGIWCVEPHSLVNQGTLHKVGRCFSVGVHPSFQRRGIFVSLSKFAIEEEKKIGQYTHILGFPQIGRSVIEGHLKAGWDFIQDIDIMSFKPNVVDEMSSLSKVSHLRMFTEKLSNGFVESSFYKMKRWLSHPDHHYICLSYKTAEIVIKPYGDSCHILSLDGIAEDVGNLLDVSKTLARRHGWKEINLWCASNNKIRDVVRDCGFSIGSERGSSVKLLAVKISSANKLEIPECNFQMGSEEMY